MEQAHQQFSRLHRGSDQLQILNRVQKQVGARPAFALFPVQNIHMRQQPAFPRTGVCRHFQRGFGHVLQHHAARAPMRPGAGRLGSAIGHGKPGGQLFRLGKIGLCTGRKRPADQGRDALIGDHTFALVDQDHEIPLADQAEGIIRFDLILVETGIGPDARRLPVFGRAIVIGGDHLHRTGAAHLDRQPPAQLDRLPDQGGQQGRFGHQGLDLRRVGML